MNKQSSTVLFLIIIFLLPIYSAAQKAKKILAQVEKNIRETNLLSYHSEYISIKPNDEDSIYKASGTVWLKKVPSDNIFGTYFHLSGNDQGKVDYFYDGQNSYEIRHKNRKIIVFDPYDYPNTPNNPAKSRTAIDPYNRLLISDNFKSTVLKNHSNVSVAQNTNQTKWIITIAYKENKYGQKVTTTFIIDKTSLRIKRIEQELKWRGSTFKTRYLFSNYKKNVDSISNSIFVEKNYADYSKEVYGQNSERKANPYKDFIGKPAPKFNFTSFSGKNISLNQFSNKIILLDFWESWCGHCLFAMPDLNHLQEKWSKDLTVIGIVTQNKKQVEKLIQENKLTYPIIYADKKILADYNVSNRPTYFLINQKGKIVTVSLGNLEKIETQITKLAK